MPPRALVRDMGTHTMVLNILKKIGVFPLAQECNELM